MVFNATNEIEMILNLGIYCYTLSCIPLGNMRGRRARVRMVV
jgi:hypothetical protein